MAVPVEHPKLGTINVVNQAIKMNRTQATMRSATPELGEHTEAVLRELGYSDDAISDLRARKAI